MGSKLITSQGEAGSWGVPPVVWHCTWEGLMVGVSWSSYQFRYAYSLFSWCVGVAQVVSRFPSGEIAPRVAVHSGCPWEEGSSRTSYAALFKDCPDDVYFCFTFQIVPRCIQWENLIHIQNYSCKGVWHMRLLDLQALHDRKTARKRFGKDDKCQLTKCTTTHGSKKKS